MNKAFIIGNLTKDPELRTTQGSVSVCTFTVAVNRKFVNSQGVREADFITVVTWRQLADLCARYLTKGQKCAVVGSIQMRTYDAQDGTRRYITEIVADDVEFLTRAGDGGHNNAPLPEPPPAYGGGSYSPTPAAPSSAPSVGAPESGFTQVEDDDLPF